MKKMIGLTLVAGLVAVMPLMAAAQMSQHGGQMTETTKTTKTTNPSGQSHTTTYHSVKPATEEQKEHPGVTKTTKQMTHKTTGKPATHTTTSTTKGTGKTTHKTSSHTVKTGKSAVKGTHPEKNPCAVKGTSTKKTQMHHEAKKTPEKQTTTTTGKSEVKEAPATQPMKPESPMQKVEHGVKKTGEEIKEGTEKIIHPGEPAKK